MSARLDAQLELFCGSPAPPVKLEPFVLPERDISRGRASAESQAAHARLEPRKAAQRYAVLVAIRQAGAMGLTCRELAGQWAVGMNTISGRFSELKSKQLIAKIGVRDGCGVYVVSSVA